MPNNLGTETQGVFLKTESHKLHQEFEVKAGETIKKGQPVKLSGAGEEIEKAGIGEANINIIGYAVHDGEGGDLVTVSMRGHMIIWAEAETALVAGPVKYQAFNAPTSRNRFDDTTVTAANHAGWAIDDAANQGDEIRVVLL